MAMSDDTKWVAGVGVVIIIALGGALGSGVLHLSSNQTAMEGRLRGDITATEKRLADHIERVDNRLAEQIAQIDTRLRTVEDKTAPLGALEARLTSTIESSEGRLSQGQQDVEKRLTAQVDKIDGRLLKVESERTRLAEIVKSSSATTQWIWPSGEGPGAKVIADLQGKKVRWLPLGTDIEALKALEDKVIGIKHFAVPAWYSYFSVPYTIQPLVNAGRSDAETPPAVP